MQIVQNEGTNVHFIKYLQPLIGLVSAYAQILQIQPIIFAY